MNWGMVLTRLQTLGVLDAADFADQNRSLTEKISRLRGERRALLNSCEDDSIGLLEELRETAEDIRRDIQNNNYSTLPSVIDWIVVAGNTELEIHLRGGLVLPETLPNVKRRCKRE